MNLLRTSTGGAVLLPLLLFLSSCNLAVVSEDARIETQVAARLQEAQTATETTLRLQTEVAATLMSEGEATATSADEPPPTANASATQPPTDPPPPTNTARPAPTDTPQATDTPLPTDTPARHITSYTITEASGIKETPLYVLPSNTVWFEASGSIWSGVAFTGPNGPNGWDSKDCDQKFPLPCAHPYSLLVRIGDGPYVEIGTYHKFDGREGAIELRINDDTPGNGSGQFTVTITVE